MKQLIKTAFVSLVLFIVIGCSTNNNSNSSNIENNAINVNNVEEEVKKIIKVGADKTESYFSLLENKKIALLVNHTSYIADRHLADSLIGAGFEIVKIFAPEHGFRGNADAGATIKDGKDTKTGLPIISLYGKNKKPSASNLSGIDIVIFDIQDVGARFYTYISSMHYMMEACAENNVQMIILDRPNPNGHYVDGPVLDEKYKSFVGMHPIPIVHGMTVGELANMINNRQWLAKGVQCDLKIITCNNYTHSSKYTLPIAPSPNLPNMRSIYLYPSLCLFEGTSANVGRGTSHQFQVIGDPKYSKKTFSYKPTSRSGAKYPKHQDKVCYGVDLSNIKIEELENNDEINWNYLIDFYNNFDDKNQFFNNNNFFEKLAGVHYLREYIKDGKNAEAIKASYKEKLENFKSIRKEYLLYEDFE